MIDSHNTRTRPKHNLTEQQNHQGEDEKQDKGPNVMHL